MCQTNAGIDVPDGDVPAQTRGSGTSAAPQQSGDAQIANNGTIKSQCCKYTKFAIEDRMVVIHMLKLQ